MTCLVCGGATRAELDHLFDDRYGHPGEFSIVRCDACGFMSTEPRLAESDLPDLYARYYPRRRTTADEVRRSANAMAIWTRLGRLRARLLTGQWAAHYEISPGMRVLDYGCGDCASLLELKALGAEPVGVEVDPNVRQIADALGVTVHVGPLTTIPAGDESFDAVTLSQVIEHVTDPEALLRDLHAKLKPGGMLALTTPNSRALTRRVLGRRWLHWHLPFHQNHFHSGPLRALLERAGFRVEHVGTFTPLPWWEYQAELVLRGSRRGEPHPYFDHGESAIRGVARRLLPITRVLAGVVARAADAAKLGDSLVVVARKPDLARRASRAA
ncbi:MAG TPA: methyltransferase domain-containing protein [Gemmatimonadaceae bacterium]|nr:methyltransferase domain-containing protein [Gemmatimonadaceae bacterium]